MLQSYDLESPLLKFVTTEAIDTWTIREAVEGVQIFGGIGSGKTSGSGRTLALKYLAAGFGGLVLTAKADEKDLWIDYCKQAGRSDDLLIVEPNGEHFFNFLTYESAYKISGTSITENIVQVLKTVIQSSETKATGKGDDRFWETALDMLIFNVIDICQLAYGDVTIEQMYAIVQSAPKGVTNFQEEKKKRQQEGKVASAFFQAFEKADKRIKAQIDNLKKSLDPDDLERWKDSTFRNNLIYEKIPEVNLYEFLNQFFLDHYNNLNEKTRSIIEFSFTGFLFRLLKEPVYSLFCRYQSTFTPEDSLKGKIILLNLPVKHYFKVGRDIQVMFKYIWQRAMERRNIKDNDRPLFLWADEAQHFLHEYDPEYQATARSSRIATVYISQNLPNYYANMGGAAADHRVKSFLGTLGTKIFHANADIETNRYASELIGEGYAENIQRGNTIAGDFSSNKNVSFELERMVRPEQFSHLKTGGPGNDGIVEGYMHRQSKVFSNKNSFKKIVFNQNPY